VFEVPRNEGEPAVFSQLYRRRVTPATFRCCGNCCVVAEGVADDGLVRRGPARVWAGAARDAPSAVHGQLTLGTRPFAQPLVHAVRTGHFVRGRGQGKSRVALLRAFDAADARPAPPSTTPAGDRNRNTFVWHVWTAERSHDTRPAEHCERPHLTECSCVTPWFALLHTSHHLQTGLAASGIDVALRVRGRCSTSNIASSRPATLTSVGAILPSMVATCRA
jgi:hypothetical protein